MKFKHVIFILGLLLIAFSLNAKESRGMSSSRLNDSKFEKYGFMGIYSPTNSGYGVSLYGIPQSTEFTARFSYFSLYMERKGTFKGGEFDDPVLDFWHKEDKEIYRKYLINLGSTQSIIANNKLFIVYFAGIGYYEEFQQYKSIYGNYWYENNENKLIGDIGVELIGRIGFLNLGLGASYQALYYLSVGVEF